jgi:hypothetical protein
MSEPSGFTPDTRNNDNSVNYLRRLKEQIDAETAADSAQSESATTTLQSKTPPRERRRSPRFKCAGSVAFTVESSQVRVWGSLTDISLRGCYVEMSNPFSIDTKVSLVIDTSGVRIRARGVVRISYPGLGMGILLTELAPEQRELLEQLLATLAHVVPPAAPELVQERTAENVLGAVDPVPFLEELQRFFTGKPNLSREEFFRIADRCHRT